MIRQQRVFANLIGASLAMISGLSGCAILQASEANFSGFLPRPELVSEQRNRAPFHGYWVFDADAYFKLRENYGRVYIASVDTSYPPPGTNTPATVPIALTPGLVGIT